MTEIPKTHPRYLSLRTREMLVEGVEAGITSKAGLIAHGRGEAFDYILGEETIPPALKAERAAIHVLMEAEKPVISVNGNVAALVPSGIVEISNRFEAKLEVNLFHRTPERIGRIISILEEQGAEQVLGLEPDAKIKGLDHERGKCTKEGIFDSDVILVPLEDGDRAQALVDMGKKVITIDLNPLSRTSRTADITIVDNIVRAVPKLLDLSPSKSDFDNEDNLSEVLDHIFNRLKKLSQQKD